MKYSVILIDDEHWTLRYLEKVFEWEKFGFELVLSAANSIEALQNIERHSPHVVFTDIRMPEIDGLELMRRIHQQNIDCCFVVISGHAEFEYAQQALREGAFDYCLKPIKPQDAESLLQKLKKHLDQKYPDAENDGFENTSVNFDYLIDYIKKHYHTKLKLSDLAKQFSFHPNYCCALFQKNMQMTFSEYLTQLRIEKSQRLLLTTSQSLEEIALQVGFEETSYYCRVFKKINNCTPGEYRKQSGCSK